MVDRVGNTTAPHGCIHDRRKVTVHEPLSGASVVTSVSMIPQKSHCSGLERATAVRTVTERMEGLDKYFFILRARASHHLNFDDSIQGVGFGGE
jgi:hypothetical protein